MGNERGMRGVGWFVMGSWFFYGVSGYLENWIIVIWPGWLQIADFFERGVGCGGLGGRVMGF
jgi:hypothetical protein